MLVEPYFNSSTELRLKDLICLSLNPSINNFLLFILFFSLYMYICCMLYLHVSIYELEICHVSSSSCDSSWSGPRLVSPHVLPHRIPRNVMQDSSCKSLDFLLWYLNMLSNFVPAHKFILGQFIQQIVFPIFYTHLRD